MAKEILMFRSFSVLLALILFVFCNFQTLNAAWRDPVRAPRAMVASQHRLASEIGSEVMKKGGNAVDAAIATAFALAVVYPEAGNLGGGGFMLIRFADGRTAAIDYREMAPAAAHRNVFVDKNGKLIRGEGSSTVGYRAPGVPGTTAGLELAFKKYGSGKVTWAQLIEPARRLAVNGFILSKRLADLFVEYKGDLEKYEDSRRIFLNNGNFYKEGDRLIQTDLAATLARIQRFGAKGFYEGETARLIAEDMQRHNGLMTLADLKNYRAKERVPLRGNYRGHEIISMPPPSSGGVALFSILNILEGFNVRQAGWASSEKYHLLIEAMRRAFADRAEYLGDPDFADVPVARLIDKSYADRWRSTISLEKASKSSDIKAGSVAAKEGSETTHFTIVDPQGNAVANTYTINDLYGSAVTAKGTGVLLNDEMDDFAARPGTPNMFGLIQGERNKVEPQKRPLSAMTPTFVLRQDGSLWFAVGARGGPRIITAVTQILINVIDHEMNIQQAMDAPRLHHQWMPDEIAFEKFGISADTRRNLERLGHKFEEKPRNLASATGIMIEEKTGVRLGAIDSRGDGEAIGF
ncbi:MAG TPA: gamma-glutamyltransferase [Pyrinomonadaceae bacterium]|jgi:gamma-glutamyltranspeptidase/glutathione hydrolase